MLSTGPLPDRRFANILSRSVSCLLAFPIVSFEAFFGRIKSFFFLLYLVFVLPVLQQEATAQSTVTERDVCVSF